METVVDKIFNKYVSENKSRWYKSAYNDALKKGLKEPKAKDFAKRFVFWKSHGFGVKGHKNEYGF